MEAIKWINRTATILAAQVHYLCLVTHVYEANQAYVPTDGIAKAPMRQTNHAANLLWKAMRFELEIELRKFLVTKTPQ